MRRRRGRGRALRRRYGCFTLPAARSVCPDRRCTVKKAARRNVTWLARTDSTFKEVEFSEHWAELTPTARKYIVLHERAHLKTGPDHNAAFYDELKKLVRANRIPWDVAYELESWNCHAKH